MDRIGEAKLDLCSPERAAELVSAAVGSTTLSESESDEREAFQDAHRGDLLRLQYGAIDAVEHFAKAHARCAEDPHLSREVAAFTLLTALVFVARRKALLTKEPFDPGRLGLAVAQIAEALAKLPVEVFLLADEVTAGKGGTVQ